ncbi:MAG: pesticin C-terminus-like muramidase [Spirochaetia bacterium]
MTETATQRASGVTIATGFDLGQHNQHDMNGIFGRPGTQAQPNPNQDLIDAYTPYLGLHGNAAVAVAGNLTITADQAARTDAAVFADYATGRNGIAARFNEATGGNFWDLPDQAQTASFDLSYNAGSVPAAIMNQVNTGDYSGAAQAIQDLGTGTMWESRRNDEAGLLRQLPNTPPPPQVQTSIRAAND